MVADSARDQPASSARTQGMAKLAQLSNQRWFPAAFRERWPDMLDRTTKSLLLQDPDFHAAIWEMIAGLDLAARLPAIDCPTLVVAGAVDINAPVAAGEKISSLIRGASLNVMSGLGHFPPFEAPEPFDRLLRRFITQNEAQ
jgi:3-oxoadipate enol-lactonase